MLPTPGTKSVRFEITMKMKNVVANGKTQRATRWSRMSPIKPSQPSTSASITFCIPDGISLMFFHVVTRTMTMMSAATIQVQIIELVTGNPRTLKISGAADGTFSSSAPVGFRRCGGRGDWPRCRPDAEAGWRFQAHRENRGEKRTGQNNFAKSLHLNKSLQSTRIPVWAIRIAGLKDWKDCLIVKKFTSNF